MDPSDSAVSDDAGKAQLLNSYFGGVFTSEELIHIPEPASQYTGKTIEVIRVSAEMVSHKLEALKVDSAPGPDGVHPKLLQLASEPLSGPLAALFQKSLDQGVLPEDSKTAAVAPIHKKRTQAGPGELPPHQPHLHTMLSPEVSDS